MWKSTRQAVSFVPKVLPLVLSTVAIALSGSSFYQTFIYSRQSMHASIINMAVSDNAVRFELALSNDGTDDTLLAGAGVIYWHSRVNDWADLPDELFQPTVVQAGRVAVASVTVALPTDPVARAMMFTTKTNVEERVMLLGLRLHAQDVSGNTYTNYVQVGDYYVTERANGESSKGSGYAWVRLDLLRQGAPSLAKPLPAYFISR